MLITPFKNVKSFSLMARPKWACASKDKNLKDFNLDEDQSNLKLSFLAGQNLRCNLKWVAKTNIGLGKGGRQNTVKTRWHYLSHFRKSI